MTRACLLCMVGIISAMSIASAAAQHTLAGVITSYQSGNEGTDLYLRTADGKTHDLWFDNLKKPLFRGKPLPWCPDFPCDGWPSQLVLGKTRVVVTVIDRTVEGKAIESPTSIALAK